jgi:hypothetical protein
MQPALGGDDLGRELPADGTRAENVESTWSSFMVISQSRGMALGSSTD